MFDGPQSITLASSFITEVRAEFLLACRAGSHAAYKGLLWVVRDVARNKRMALTDCSVTAYHPFPRCAERLQRREHLLHAIMEESSASQPSGVVAEAEHQTMYLFY